MPGTQVPEVDDGIGVGFENRTATLDDVGVATDHHQQTPFRRRWAAAAHGRVDDRNTLAVSPFREISAGVGVHGAVHRDNAARLHRRQQPVLAVGEFLDVGVTDDAQADQIAGRGEFGQ